MCVDAWYTSESPPAPGPYFSTKCFSVIAFVKITPLERHMPSGISTAAAFFVYRRFLALYNVLKVVEAGAAEGVCSVQLHTLEIWWMCKTPILHTLPIRHVCFTNVTFI